MKLCGRCGAPNDDVAEFCGGCGTFLEFDEAQESPTVATPGVPSTPAPATTTAAGGARPAGAVQGAPAPTGGATVTGGARGPSGVAGTPAGAPAAGGASAAGASAAGAPAAGAPAAGAPAAGGAVAAGTPSQAATAGTPATGVQTQATTAEGAPTPEAGASTTPAAVIPVAVQPGAAEVRKQHRGPVVAEDRPKPGDVLCPKCGKGNTPERRFCRGCGTALVGGEEVRPPWWRRVLRALRPKPMVAGTRPKRRRSTRVVPAVLVVALGAVAISALPTVRPIVRRGYDSARGAVLDRFSQPTQLVPKSATASSSAKGDSPNLLIDGANDTFWAPQVPAPAKGEWCRVDLDRPSYVANMLITSGVAPKEETFRTEARPAKVEIQIKRKDGATSKITKDLDDSPKPQEIRVRVSGVTQITITILDAYGAQPDRVVAIAEVEVFIRR